jgi:hypothetical protein
VLHAVPVGQSPEALHPQAPLGSQTAPADAPVQMAQVSPPVPQAPPAVPSTHRSLVASQQPPLQLAAPQLCEHEWVVGSQAW